MEQGFNGMHVHLGNLSMLSNAKSRSISAENETGAKGAGGMSVDGPAANVAAGLGQGWKVSPYKIIKAGQEHVLAEINESGVIQHIWCTTNPTHWRFMILKIYWDGEEQPSVETPLGDFFCNGWGEPVNVNSIPVAVNPRGAFNCYWTMPFRRSAKITITSLHDTDTALYYQIDYILTDVPADAAYFHAQFRRTNPLPYKDVYTIVDGVKGRGHFVGVYMAWQVNSNRWWGEGEIKFYMDGDKEFPTICGTGTEDYFGGAWNWEHPRGQYGTYSTAYLGMHQVIKPDGLYNANQRFGMYRWHVQDPIRFEQDLRVTIQALGWRPDYKRYLPLKDDISSVAFWYQTEPHAAYPVLPERDELEII